MPGERRPCPRGDSRARRPPGVARPPCRAREHGQRKDRGPHAPAKLEIRGRRHTLPELNERGEQIDARIARRGDRPPRPWVELEEMKPSLAILDEVRARQPVEPRGRKNSRCTLDQLAV